MKYGLVFAGGGVRGAYQIGVIKAIKELGIEVSAVCGTSIGAINGALFVQGGIDEAEKLWRNIRLEDIVKIPGEKRENLLSISKISEIVKKVSDGGFDISPLENLLKSLIDEDKIRKSEIDFGLVSISLTNRKTVKIFKDDIPRGEIYDYLIAGASLPVFKVKKINGERFIDGGISDNMPVGMLIEKGITDIIAVDVHGIGVKRDVCEAGVNLIEINCSKPQTGTLDFNREGIEKSIEEGYYDSKKVLGIFDGKKYFFDAHEYNGLKRLYGMELLGGIEEAAQIFGLEKFCLYKFDDLVKKTIDAYRKCLRQYNALYNVSSDMAEAAVIYLIKMIKEGNKEFIKKKLDIFGKYYEAASALIYFERKFK